MKNNVRCVFDGTKFIPQQPIPADIKVGDIFEVLLLDRADEPHAIVGMDRESASLPSNSDRTDVARVR